jgi:hypothetical protein
MKGSSDNSFIPKRGSTKRAPTGGANKLHVFTYISYILMFATLLSSGGVFLYAQYANSQLDVAVEALSSEIKNFSQADMERVIQLDLRLLQAQDRLENSISITSAFEALQAATIDTVQISSLAMEREDDSSLLIEAAIQTDSFDSTIFQRRVFSANSILQAVTISNVQNTTLTQSGSAAQEPAVRPIVSFLASLSISLDEVPANPQSNQSPAVNLSREVSEQSIEQSAPEEDVNDDTI